MLTCLLFNNTSTDLVNTIKNNIVFDGSVNWTQNVLQYIGTHIKIYQISYYLNSYIVNFIRSNWKYKETYNSGTIF